MEQDLEKLMTAALRQSTHDLFSSLMQYVAEGDPPIPHCIIVQSVLEARISKKSMTLNDLREVVMEIIDPDSEVFPQTDDMDEDERMAAELPTPDEVEES